jgi:hypothetical protein
MSFQAGVMELVYIRSSKGRALVVCGFESRLRHYSAPGHGCDHGLSFRYRHRVTGLDITTQQA